MQIITLTKGRLSLACACLGLAVIDARAARFARNLEIVHLPTYTEKVTRLSPAARPIERSLKAFRATGREPLPIKIRIPLLNPTHRVSVRIFAAPPAAEGAPAMKANPEQPAAA